jgi:uncharacterized protein YegP (UPF0339 family)
MNINSTFQFKKVRKMQNLGNVYIWGSPFVMSRTDAQNGVEIIFKIRDFTIDIYSRLLTANSKCILKSNGSCSKFGQFVRQS